MSIDVVIIFGAVAFVAGVILTLRWIGQRPINVNVNAHAEAHGGSAHAGAAPAQVAPAPVGGSLMGILRFVVIAAIVVFCLAMAGSIINKINEPTKVTVNVPAQVPQPAPNIIIPKAEPPTINVTPQAPVVVAPSLLDTLSLAIGAVALVAVIFICYRILKVLKAQTPPPVVHQPVTYIKTDYGWTTEAAQSEPARAPDRSPIQAEDVVPGLFVRRDK